MIVTDIRQLREIPVGETAVLVLHLKVAKTDMDSIDPCEGCILNGPGCGHCSANERPDKKEVKFIKIQPMEEDLLQMARYWASQSKAIKKYRMARATDVTEIMFLDTVIASLDEIVSSVNDFYEN